MYCSSFPVQLIFWSGLHSGADKKSLSLSLFLSDAEDLIFASGEGLRPEGTPLSREYLNAAFLQKYK